MSATTQPTTIQHLINPPADDKGGHSFHMRGQERLDLIKANNGDITVVGFMLNSKGEHALSIAGFKTGGTLSPIAQITGRISQSQTGTIMSFANAKEFNDFITNLNTHGKTTPATTITVDSLMGCSVTAVFETVYALDCAIRTIQTPSSASADWQLNADKDRYAIKTMDKATGAIKEYKVLKTTKEKLYKEEELIAWATGTERPDDLADVYIPKDDTELISVAEWTAAAAAAATTTAPVNFTSSNAEAQSVPA